MEIRRQKLLFSTSITAIFVPAFLSGCEAPPAQNVLPVQGTSAPQESLMAAQILPAQEGSGTTYGRSSMPQYSSIEELPPNLRERVDELHAARDREFTRLDTMVDQFSITEVTVPEAVTRLSSDHNVLCGIEVIPWPAGPKGLRPASSRRLSLSLQRQTPRQILDKLVSMDPTFIWSEDQGVANLVMRQAYQSPDYPLKTRIPKFQAKDRPYTMVFGGGRPALFGLPQVYESLVFGSSGRWPREFEPRVSVDAVDATVRQIINDVARKVGMSWSAVLCQLPNGDPVVWFHMHPRMPLAQCSSR